VFALADFVPLFDRHDAPLNPPNAAGHHSDQGVMAVNYRNEPIRERRGDPAYWFHSLRRSYRWGPSPPPRVRRHPARDPGHRRLRELPQRPDPHPRVPGLARGAAQLPDPRHALAPVPGRPYLTAAEPANAGDLRGVRLRHLPAPAGGAAEWRSGAADSPYGPGDYLWKSGPVRRPVAGRVGADPRPRAASAAPAAAVR
jgi:hypothetical protein